MVITEPKGGETMISIVWWLFLLLLVVLFIGGGVVMFFVMRNNPKYLNISKMAKTKLEALSAKIKETLQQGKTG